MSKDIIAQTLLITVDNMEAEVQDLRNRISAAGSDRQDLMLEIAFKEGAIGGVRQALFALGYTK